jgi:hypothetical protein
VKPARDFALVASAHVIAAIVPGPTFLRAASPHARRTPVGLLRFLGRFAPVRDLFLCAKDLFIAAIDGWSTAPCSDHGARGVALLI